MDAKERHSVLEDLRQHGWVVEASEIASFNLPERLKTRYHVLPPALTEFLVGLTVCSNAEQTAWFLCQADFEGQSSSAWHWNEFELMLREWAETEQEKSEITRFWDTHFPILLSVSTGYAFFAICVGSEKLGQVVHSLLEYGVDETTAVAASFGEFCSLLLAGQFPAETGIDSRNEVKI